MKDPTDAIITTFYDVLNGNLSYNDKDWPFKTFGEADEDFDNAMLVDVTIEDDSDEDFRITDCTVLLDIRQGSKNMGSWKATNTISNQIIELIAYQDLSFLGYDQVREITYTANLLTEYTSEYVLTRKLLRFIFKLQEQ